MATGERVHIKFLPLQPDVLPALLKMGDCHLVVQARRGGAVPLRRAFLADWR